MGMIYLKKSITCDKELFEAQRKSFNSKILISHIDSEKVCEVDDFSLDITLGKSWNENYSYNDRSLFMIEGSGITINPRSSVVVSIRENISIPNNIFGIVISTGSIFLQHGVQSPTAKIEPGYSGVLILRLVNYSDSVVHIKKGEKIASVIFLRTEHTPTYTFATNSESTNIRKKGNIEKLKLTIKSTFSKNWFNILTLLFAFLALILSYMNYNYPNTQTPQTNSSQIQK